MTDTGDKGLIEALRFGEAACLTMAAFEPISANVGGWKEAAQRIKHEREKLERASTTPVMANVRVEVKENVR